VKRTIAGMVVLVSVLVAPRATAQTSPQPQPYWSPRDTPPVESVGEVVLTFTTPGTGRWEYYTKDGDCDGYPSAEDPANETPLSPAECGRPFARAGEDYVAVRGEWIFTAPGSRTITIPIMNDDLDETDGEAFSINAFYKDSALGHLVNAYIRIEDDDPNDDGDAPAVVVTTVTRADQRSTGASAPPARAPTTVAAPPADLAVALPSGELEPGPGFELVSEGASGPASELGGDSDGGSPAARSALVLGSVAVAAGAAVWVRRRRRWSPTRP
jgi:hypothetical protein